MEICLADTKTRYSWTRIQIAIRASSSTDSWRRHFHYCRRSLLTRNLYIELCLMGLQLKTRPVTYSLEQRDSAGM
jgi:hypothetical protein